MTKKSRFNFSIKSRSNLALVVIVISILFGLIFLNNNDLSGVTGKVHTKSTSSTRCYETDNGIDYSNKGRTIFNGISYPDSCTADGRLEENFCSTSGIKSTRTYTCPSGKVCLDGACASSSTRGIKIHVKEQGTNLDLQGVSVLIERLEENGLFNRITTQTTGLSGTVSIPLSIGKEHRFTISKDGYNSYSPVRNTIPSGTTIYTYGPYYLVKSTSSSSTPSTIPTTTQTIPQGTWCGYSSNYGKFLCEGIEPSQGCPQGYTQKMIEPGLKVCMKT